MVLGIAFCTGNLTTTYRIILGLQKRQITQPAIFLLCTSYNVRLRPLTPNLHTLQMCRKKFHEIKSEDDQFAPVKWQDAASTAEKLRHKIPVAYTLLPWLHRLVGSYKISSCLALLRLQSKQHKKINVNCHAPRWSWKIRCVSLSTGRGYPQQRISQICFRRL